MSDIAHPNCQGILDSSLTARIGETVTLRDGADNQVAIFTHIRTKQGGRRDPDTVARTAKMCAAAPDLLESLTNLVGLAKLGAAHLDKYHAALSDAESAIAKARGES